MIKEGGKTLRLFIVLIFMNWWFFTTISLVRDYFDVYFTVKSIELCAGGKYYSISDVPFGTIWECNQ